MRPGAGATKTSPPETAKKEESPADGGRGRSNGDAASVGGLVIGATPH